MVVVAVEVVAVAEEKDAADAVAVMVDWIMEDTVSLMMIDPKVTINRVVRKAKVPPPHPPVAAKNNVSN